MQRNISQVVYFALSHTHKVCYLSVLLQSIIHHPFILDHLNLLPPRRIANANANANAYALIQPSYHIRQRLIN